MPVESNYDALAARITKFAAKRGKRVTEKRAGPDRANNEVEGHMADEAMLARTSLMVIGSWTLTGMSRTWAPS